MNCPSSRWVESLTALNGTFLDLEAQIHHRWEGVGELQNASCRDEPSQIAHLGNGRGNDKRNGPVHWHNSAPGQFACLGSKARKLEEVHEHVVVNDFDANVAIEQGRDKARGETERVRYCLPHIATDSLIRNDLNVFGVSVSVFE